jgi:quinohemoprotein ethanol dehydrogenase
VGLIDDARIVNQAEEPGNWLAHGRTYSERRFSPLTQIDRKSVQRLGLAWHKDMGTRRAQEATPIVVDGVMFVTSAWSRVFALDAASGKQLWGYDPQVDRAWARRMCCDVVNRGVAVYQGRVYLGALDGRLIALNAATGAVEWAVDTIVDRDRFYSITGAPRVARGKVFIGNGGAEFGVRGYVSAYDADSGELAWRFFTVPGDPSQPYEHPELVAAAKTWSGDVYWEFGGGGTVWDAIVYDPEFEQLYIGTGNGSPWTRAIRSPGGGDNLYLSSIVALDPDTGRMRWHYQTTPADNWDYTATQPIALAELSIDGEPRKVLLQAPKNGFFYVLDRQTGELLRAHPYSVVTWATHVDMETGRPVENPDLSYLEQEQWVLPGSAGAHGWQPMAVDQASGTVYIPTQESPLIFGMADEWKDSGEYLRDPGRWNNGLELGRFAQLVEVNAPTSPSAGGALIAFDPITGNIKWSVRNAYYWNGGVLATAGGLVFQGDAAGKFSAYDKDTGEVLWHFDTYTSILAPPITYQIDGVQYVALLTGGGGGDLFGGEAPTAMAKYGNQGQLLVFNLGGDGSLEPPEPVQRVIPEQEPIEASDAEIAGGEALYNNYCAMCHGLLARSGGSIPDLRLLTAERHATFSEIVLDGVLAPLGMAGFGDVLSAADSEAIHTYIRARADQDRAQALGDVETPRMTWHPPPATSVE